MSQRISFLNLAVLLSLDLYHVFLSEDCWSTCQGHAPKVKETIVKTRLLLLASQGPRDLRMADSPFLLPKLDTSL